MSRKLAIKRLTSSDLTIFKWHHKTLHDAGNQKAINLNADVFIKLLYPILPELPIGRQGRIPLDLLIYGPGSDLLYNLQRKIIKNATYKNWRLNGEFIDNPENEPERFNILVPDDIVVFEFTGVDVPTAAKAVFVTNTIESDKFLFSLLNASLARKSMIAITGQDMEALIIQAGTHINHPIRQLSLDNDLEEAVMMGDIDAEKISQKPSLRKVTKEDFFRAKRTAEGNGQRGEELINNYFEVLRRINEISAFEWTSDINPIYPYDFELITRHGQKTLLDVKSTEGEFRSVFFISINELRQMAHCESYDLYRVYELEETTAKLRIARNMKPFAKAILDILEKLPDGVTSTGISVSPEMLAFGNEMQLEIEIYEE